MSDFEDDFDITNSVAQGSGIVASDSSDSDSDASDYELQDEIVSSDEEDVKPAKPADNKFPTLELDSDDENDQSTTQRPKRREEDLDEYFAPAPTKKLNSGTFAGLGLSKRVVNNVSKKGFKLPTPIQRKTIPLILDGRDVVGMARTGSGKTAAFVLPMIERLKVHSAKVGARGLILSPNRELALQTLKVVKDFSRGTDLRSVLLVGGDGLEEQFGYIMSNPDIIIATPGRFMHLKVEMQLDLKSVEYIVFDEADSLFEMGFAEQLNEIIASLSSSRQSLLFSATLPKTLVEFAKAGLHDPVLVRLDADTKISNELEMGFFSVKDGEKDAALLCVLDTIIHMPPATEEQKKFLARERHNTDDEDEDENESKQRDRKKKKFVRERLPSAMELPTPESTIVFVPTKHHVEYVSNLLISLGYAVSYIYGTLDQTARKEQLHRFRAGKTSLLVVTDVAARGIDIPVLANVINYTLPSSPKVFVHRVGRTARAGRRGWAYSLVKESEVPYLLDLEIFLGRRLVLSLPQRHGHPINYSENLVLGSLPRDNIEFQQEEVDAMLSRDYDLALLRTVATRGEKLYVKSRESASLESFKRAKGVMADGWDHRHLLVGPSVEDDRQSLLNRLANRKVKETVFEFKKTASSVTAAELMARRREQLAPIQRRAAEKKRIQEQEKAAGLDHGVENEVLGLKRRRDGDDDEVASSDAVDMSAASEADLSAFDQGPQNKKKPKSFRDPNYYMSHYASLDSVQERGYSLSGGNGTFADAARCATFDLSGEGKDFQQKTGMRWDKRRGKYINVGSDSNIKYIKGENGQRIPASFRSGRFDNWKAAHKTGDVKVGSMEAPATRPGPGGDSHRFRHKNISAPKAADKGRDDYHVRKKRVQEATAKGLPAKGVRGKITNGLKTVDQVRKQREVKDQRREKNARPSKKGKSKRR